MAPEIRTSTAECPPEATFVELIEGRLDRRAAANLRRHVETCDACHALLDELTAAETAKATRIGEIDARIARALQEGRTTWADPDQTPVGETIAGTYRLVRVVGAGGMGQVYEAEHTQSGERFAVKLINGRLLVRGSEAPSRFRREARAAGAIDSPHIVRVVDSGMDEVTSDLYLVMEYLRGEDLQQLIDRLGPLRPDVALRIAAQALVGLTEAHAAGIVHRDIKPANLFLARDGEGGVTVKLLDFGIAKISPDPLSLPHTTGLTHTGGLLGSPLYMSPEQVQNSKDVDHRTDLWSLGSTLYTALAGRAPHRGVSSVGKLVLAICGSPAPSLREVAPWVPPEIAEAVHHSLAIEREARYPSASAMLDTLRALLPDGIELREEMLAGISPEERASTAPSLPPPPTARTRAGTPLPHPSARFVTAAGIALALGAAGYGIARFRAPAPSASAPVGTISPTTPGPSAPAPPTATPAPETMRRVMLVIFPEDASVEVDGARVDVQGGAVEIAGALGSDHRIRVHKGESEAVAHVTVTEKGASPPKVELASKKPTTAVRPAPVADGQKTAAPPAEGTAAPASARRPPEPSVDEILRKPE